MRLRNMLGLLLALALAFGVWAQPAYAAGTAELSVSSGTVEPGGEVTLTVSIRDNPGIAAALVYIYYDTAVFSVDPNRDLQSLGAFRDSGELLGNTTAVARANGVYDGEPDKDGALFLWDNSSGMNTNGDGGMVSITLHAAENAVAGRYEISLGAVEGNVCDENAEDVLVTFASGAVTVAGEAVQRPGQGGGTQTPAEPDPIPDPGPEPTPPEQIPEQTPSQTEPVTPDGPDAPAGADKAPEETGQESRAAFADTAGSWAEAYINEAAARGLIEGYNGLYRPGDSMTRAELVTILWRASGSPEGGSAGFTDLTQDWYREAVAWAEENGYVNGVGGGRFDPDGHVSREQLAVVLHRMAGYPVGIESLVSGLYNSTYTDSGVISDWARASLYWAVYREVYCGENALEIGPALAPGADANRAQIAVMIVRYLNLD